MSNKSDNRFDKWLIKSLICCGVLVELLHCGGSGGGIQSSSENNDTADSEEEVILTEKLVGTPFEGLTRGDEFPEYYFICDQYRTETIDGFPIPVFLAMFSESEEEIVREGIEIANTSIGFDAYEIQETWTDDVRVIYKVTYLDSAAATTHLVIKYFNSRIRSEHHTPDWAIAIRASYIDKWIIAHEMGHATGIDGHYKIDYENDTILDLEENSLMGNNVAYITDYTLNDYNFMMSMQYQIMLDHLDEEGTLLGGDCNFLKEYYDSQ